MGNFLDLHALLSAFLLSASVSADALAVGFSYGASRIHVPLRSLLMIAAICTAVTGGFVCLGTIALPIIPPAMESILSVCLLCGVACIRLCDSTVKQLIRRHPALSRQLQFRVFDLRVILHICTDSTAADSDHSKTISVKEAVALALALSLDGAAAGIGAGVGSVPVIQTILFSFLFTLAAFSLGGKLGNLIEGKLQFECGFFSGALLLILAALRIFALL